MQQRRAGLGETDKGAALVQLQPALGDRVVKGRPVLGRRALQLEQKWLVDLLDIDPASWMGSNALASSRSLRAATSGSAKGRPSANVMWCMGMPRSP